MKIKMMDAAHLQDQVTVRVTFSHPNSLARATTSRKRAYARTREVPQFGPMIFDRPLNLAR